ncbi:hypothetical protein RHECNPAF_4310045 [Rhizobium etli CNPAF512]|nr:hypothetical protein RHECNPAF_4310045 [Rhizobium etli CNPAF512]
MHLEGAVEEQNADRVHGVEPSGPADAERLHRLHRRNDPGPISDRGGGENRIPRKEVMRQPFQDRHQPRRKRKQRRGFGWLVRCPVAALVARAEFQIVHCSLLRADGIVGPHLHLDRRRAPFVSGSRGCRRIGSPSILKVAGDRRGAETILDQIRSKTFLGDGDEADGRPIRLNIGQANPAQDQIERSPGLRLGRLVEDHIHGAVLQGAARIVGEFVADEEDAAFARMPSQHIDQCGIAAAGIVEASKVRIHPQGRGQEFRAEMLFVETEPQALKAAGAGVLEKIVRKAADSIAVHLIDRMADRKDGTGPASHSADEERCRPAGGIIVDADEFACMFRGASDDVDNRQTLGADLLDGRADHRIAGYRQDQACAPQPG